MYVLPNQRDIPPPNLPRLNRLAPHSHPNPSVRTDLFVSRFWPSGRELSIDFCVTDADARCNQGKTAAAITRDREKLKKDHHVDVCRLNRMDFTAFIATCDGVYGREADRFIRRLAELINQRGGWDQHGTGRVEQWIRARLSVCLARSVSACLRRPRRKGRCRYTVYPLHPCHDHTAIHRTP